MKLQPDWLHTIPLAAQRHWLVLRQQLDAALAKLQNFTATNRALAEHHLAQGNYADAALRFRLVVWQLPKDASAWAGLAESHALNRSPEKAAAALSRALSLDAANARALAVKARLTPAHDA